MKASLGSVDFITSFCKSEDESKKIKEAVNASSYGSEFVHAALAVNQKVMFLPLWVLFFWWGGSKFANLASFFFLSTFHF